MISDIWFLTERQLWPKIGYGLCCNTASLGQLSVCLSKQFWQILPIGGVVRSAPKELRQIDRGFYGVGLLHPGVESVAAQLNKLLMHYGCKSSIGMKLTISLAYLTLEVGMSDQPLQESYKQYSSWTTQDRKSTRLNSSHLKLSRMPSSA